MDTELECTTLTVLYTGTTVTVLYNDSTAQGQCWSSSRAPIGKRAPYTAQRIPVTNNYSFIHFFMKSKWVVRIIS